MLNQSINQSTDQTRAIYDRFSLAEQNTNTYRRTGVERIASHLPGGFLYSKAGGERHMKKRKLLKSITAFTLAVVMAMSQIPGTDFVLTAYADSDKTITGLGTGAITNPIVPGTQGDTANWDGNYVYYGKYNSNSVKYRVLTKSTSEFDGNTMLLDCDGILIYMQHHNSSGSYSWAESKINAWLNGNDFYNSEDVFTPQEKNAIAASTKSDFSNDGSGREGYATQNLSGEHAFLLDAKEVTRPSYGYADKGSETDSNKKKNGPTSFWWLRSHCENVNPNIVLASHIIFRDSSQQNAGVSPAFNINLSSIMFSSLVSGTAGNAGAEYTLTLEDTDRTINISSGSGITRDSDTQVTVPYTKDRDSNHVSLLITNKNDKWTNGTGWSDGAQMQYYTTAAVSESTGTVTLSIPENYDANKDAWQAWIIPEIVNTGNYTDYAGTPVAVVDIPPAHTHSFTYSASGATITATCSADGCPLPPSTSDGSDHVAKLTIAAPEHKTYGDGNDAAAQITDANSIQGDAKVQYQKKTGESYETATETAPTDAGDYKASITLGPGTDQKTATASVEYTIAKATPTITTVPTASEITYGKTLENSTLTDGTASVGGTFAWETKTTAPSVADSQSTEYDVVFTPDDSANYNTAECKVKLTVNPKEVGLSWAGTNLTYNGQEQAPTATATNLVSGDEGKVSVTVTGGQTNARTEAYTATANGLTGDKADNYTLPTEKTTSYTISPRSISEATVTLNATSLPYTGSSQTVTVSGVKLGETDLSTSDYDVSGQTSGTDIGTYAVTVVGKGNYKDSATAQWSITQATPTIDPAPSASDITYGQTLSDSKLTGGKAKVGDTEISGTFSWKNGSTKPSVADSGETEYIVVFTPTDTTKYKPAETEVTLTVKKAEPTAAAVTANNRKYDGTKKPLVTIDESILVGGTMQYALGKDAKTAPEEGWSETIPSAAEKGEYYVWYKVVGDENHEDTEPAYVTAKIEARQFTITYDLNGGKLDGETGKVTRTAKEGEVITLPAPTRDGYTFDYWEGSRYNAGDKYTVTEDHSFKAVWKTGAGGDSSKGGSSKGGAKTGDPNDIAGLLALMLASGGALGAIGYRRRKETDK